MIYPLFSNGGIEGKSTKAKTPEWLRELALPARLHSSSGLALQASLLKLYFHPTPFPALRKLGSYSSFGSPVHQSRELLLSGKAAPLLFFERGMKSLTFFKTLTRYFWHGFYTVRRGGSPLFVAEIQTPS